MHLEFDNETKRDLMDSFAELFSDIEAILDASEGAGDEETMNRLFRAIHSIKGNAAIMQLDLLVEFTHVIEDVAEALRSNRYPLSPPISECILLGLDRLRDLHNRELWGQEFGYLYEKELQERFALLAEASPDACDRRAFEIIEMMQQGVSAEENQDSSDSSTIEEVEGEITAGAKQPLVLSEVGSERRIQEDLSYFKELSECLDRQNEFWVDRSVQLFEWAHKINKLANSPVDAKQLTAAIYLHDMGMLFLPKDVLKNQQQLDEQELTQLKQHPAIAAQFLQRVSGWNDAAVMVLHHHEWVNGQGYPQGIKANAIHDGAKILAILDAFFSIVNGRADRTRRKSTVRAISEINAGAGTQFDRQWVLCFNEMIKAERRNGVL